jgi:hypothetical protein
MIIADFGEELRLVGQKFMRSPGDGVVRFREVEIVQEEITAANHPRIKEGQDIECGKVEIHVENH